MKRIIFVFLILIYSLCFSYDIISIESAGRGGTFVAIFGDYTNPAGLDTVDRNEISLEYGSMIEGINFQSISLVFPTQFAGGFGIQLNRINYGSFVIRNEIGNVIREFSWVDTITAFSYGKKIYKEFYIGSSLKYLNINLENFSKAEGFSFDLGLFYQPLDMLSLGVELENLSDAKVKDEHGVTQIISPLVIHSGIAFMPWRKWKFALDIESEKRNFINCFSIGGEVKISDLILRSGLTIYSKGGRVISCGLGYKVGKNISIDYALLYSFDVDFIHRGSFSIEFGPSSYARKHLYRGTILMKNEKWEEAIIEFKKVLEVEPDNKDALFNQYYVKGILLLKDEKLKETLDIWEKAVAIKPEDVKIKEQIAVVKAKLEKKIKEERERMRKERGKIAVVDFEAIKPLSEELALSVSENLRTALSKYFEVVERKYMIKIAEEQQLQMKGFIDSNTAVQFGKLVGAKTIVLGSITKIAEIYTLNVRFVSVETGMVIQSEQISCKSEAEIPELIEKVVKLLIEKNE